jgi:NAD-dependent dihydropyrimidine dehydrogenase PreA subunit
MEMCEFCTKHGEGKKWYLQAKNYSDDLLADVRRRKIIFDFFTAPGGIVPADSPLGRLDTLQRQLPELVRQTLTPHRREAWLRAYCHQVLPIEDVEEIFKFLGSVVRMPCLCRQKKNAKEQRYCYGLSLKPENGELFSIIQSIDKSYLAGPDNLGLERLTKEQALNNFREYEHEGAFHAVYIFVEPFIAGICNCDRADCIPMSSDARYPALMARGEYVARVDPELCSGCRACMRVCQFGAIGYSVANKLVSIDQERCYGCGVCRADCTRNAIMLYERSAVPAAAGIL